MSGGTPIFQAQKMCMDGQENTVIPDEIFSGYGPGLHHLNNCYSHLLHQPDGSDSLRNIQLSLTDSSESEDEDGTAKNKDLLKVVSNLKMKQDKIKAIRVSVCSLFKEEK
ncbi:LOW QUALITY PROTEIN: Serine-rich coiled-coil domain-containing protein 2 [Galemys pyrenaicus]|uniref:Serine-rich coiled-coil domain-containing protein 2 n=1 Tax=Galemys pyrenaicus TaxID=202257 RepID=A0A8J6A0J2_GALPY|nr:LOW QUALITY PROTEIN: Serine-rich coiled-coil domain-containing protein 2 [Galemys pyrenaicus]